MPGCNRNLFSIHGLFSHHSTRQTSKNTFLKNNWFQNPLISNRRHPFLITKQKQKQWHVQFMINVRLRQKFLIIIRWKGSLPLHSSQKETFKSFPVAIKFDRSRRREQSNINWAGSESDFLLHFWRFSINIGKFIQHVPKQKIRHDFRAKNSQVCLFLSLLQTRTAYMWQWPFVGLYWCVFVIILS